MHDIGLKISKDGAKAKVGGGVGDAEEGLEPRC